MWGNTDAFDTQTLLHTDALYTQTLGHKGALAHRTFTRNQTAFTTWQLSQATEGNYTQTLLHIKHFYTQTFTHSRLLYQTLQHTDKSGTSKIASYLTVLAHRPSCCLRNELRRRTPVKWHCDLRHWRSSLISCRRMLRHGVESLLNLDFGDRPSFRAERVAPAQVKGFTNKFCTRIDIYFEQWVAPGHGKIATSLQILQIDPRHLVLQGHKRYVQLQAWVRTCSFLKERTVFHTCSASESIWRESNVRETCGDDTFQRLLHFALRRCTEHQVPTMSCLSRCRQVSSGEGVKMRMCESPLVVLPRLSPQEQTWINPSEAFSTVAVWPATAPHEE